MLVNNAGIGGKVSLEDEPLDDFRHVMEVNVTAIWHLCKLFRDALVADGGGSIVNVASMLGHVGSTPVKQASYCASKGAVVNLTRELALQLARRNVRVNALCPGWFQSEMTAGMESDEGAIAFIKANGPMPRMGDTHELDGALLLLSSGGRHVHDRPVAHRRRRLDGPLTPVLSFTSGPIGPEAKDRTRRSVRPAAADRPRGGRPRAARRRGSSTSSRP